LKTKKNINPAKIGLIGHSEGGMIAPVVAAKNSDLAFIILLAGPGTTGKQILLAQSELIARADSTPEADIQSNLAVSRKIYDLMDSQKDPKKLAPLLKELLKKEAATLTEEERIASNLTDAGINNVVLTVCSAWFMEFVRFDPQPWLKKVSCPVLALNGERDLQVPCTENLTAIEKALKSGKCKDYTVTALPGLNHLFQHCTSCRIDEYGKISETFSPEVLKMMADWIMKNSE
jgi:pimeloyl-ACP methyl ester carboxylesterase